ncbi:ionotropic receptor 75a-like [Bacillus rossius redtenbacheri]|uniref:ionotropic receptor 75a-like n=1 Tax=Bacillus rossius redtenbacheri TaxID=93214 RepID=UPI002FDDEDD5
MAEPKKRRTEVSSDPAVWMKWLNEVEEDEIAGTSLDSRRAAWRLLLLVMLVLTVLLNNYYGACVVSSLLTEPPSSITTVRHLIDSPLGFGAEKMFYSSIMFELSSNPLVKELYNKKMLGRHGEKPVYYTREEGVTKMMREDFVFHTEAIPLYELINEKYHGEEKCRLTEIKVFPSLDMYIVVPHKSPLKEMLMCGLLRLSESGVLGHMKSKLIPKKPTCLPESELFSVELANVVPAFTILLSGVIALTSRPAGAEELITTARDSCKWRRGVDLRRLQQLENSKTH